MFDNNKDGINKNNSGKNNIHVRIMKKNNINTKNKQDKSKIE